jgi:hypothetical protein
MVANKPLLKIASNSQIVLDASVTSRALERRGGTSGEEDKEQVTSTRKRSTHPLKLETHCLLSLFSYYFSQPEPQAK